MRSPDAPSGSTLRALLVEDSENDALLLAEELRRGGYEPVCERVSTPEEMELALAEASARGTLAGGPLRLLHAALQGS